jgi:asparagine N-glycosylation enzyme membrane subunit Stt3
MLSAGARLSSRLLSGRKEIWWDVLGVCGLAAVAVLLRCVRLFDSSSNHIFNPDSYFFHWVSQRVMAGEGPPSGTSGVNYTLHSGFAYPAAYIAKAVGFTFHMSSTDSLAMVFKFLPPAIAVLSIVLLYLVLTRLLNSRIAFFSALTWALLFQGMVLGAAGNLDRDALTVLLLMVGAMLFYLSRSWKFNVGSRDVGWIFSGLSVLLIQLLLYVEWGLQGAVMLLAIIFVYSVLKLVLEYSSLLDKEPNVMRRMAIASRRSDLRALVLVVAINLFAVGMYSHQSAQTFNVIWAIIKGRLSAGTGIAGASEEQGLSFGDLLGFQFFLVPIVLGIYLAWKQRNDVVMFFAGWFLSFLILSFFVYRMIVVAVPAACVISGVGLASLVGIMASRDAKNLWKQLGILVLLVLMVLISSVSAATLNRNNYILAADKDWQEALAYLRASTSQDAVVMSQWSYGYWIVDVAQREPFVDNGYYRYTLDQLHDVGLAYSTADPSEAAAIMTKCGTEYLVFGKQDLDLAGTIMGWAGLNSKEGAFPEDSLIQRSLNGDFLSGDGLELVFKNNEVVILALAQPGQT